jgi:hypothetical protein
MVTKVTEPLLEIAVSGSTWAGLRLPQAAPADRLRTAHLTVHAMAFLNAIVRPSVKVDSKNGITRTFFQPA